MLKKSLQILIQQCNSIHLDLQKIHLHQLQPKPSLSDFYTPSEDHHNHELTFIMVSMIGIGAFLWYSNK